MKRDKLLALVQKMPRAYQEILRLKLEEDLSFAEIAEQLGLTEGTAKIYYYRAAALLAKGMR